MNWEKDLAGESPELKHAIEHFRASMDAWSDAALSRPRAVTKMAARPAAAVWRKMAGWALGCLLVAGSLAGVFHAISHQQQMTKLAEQKPVPEAATQQISVRPAAAPVTSAPVTKTTPSSVHAKIATKSEDEDLLASVDKDIARQVPEAMEPLAQLMGDN